VKREWAYLKFILSLLKSSTKE